MISWVDEQGSLRRLGLFRVLVGVLLLRHTLPFLEHARGRFFADRFFLPYVDWLPVPGRTAYFAILIATCVAGALVIAGLFTRMALATGLLLGSWVFLSNQLFYSNNRFFLMLCLLALLVSPSHRAVSIDAWRRGGPPDPVGPVWTAYLLRAQCSLLYLASGLSKLVDPDWAGGSVFWLRLEIVLGQGSALLQALSPARSFLGAAAIGLELFLALGLWFPRTRRPALWLGFLFHLAIEIAFAVHVFSYLMLGTYLLVPRGAQKSRILRWRAGSSVQRWLVAPLGALDWLGKVAIEPSDRLEAVDADGAVYRGPMALAIAGAAIPITFPIAYPFTWLRRRARTGAGEAPAGRPVGAGTPIALLAGSLASITLVSWDSFRGLGVHGKGAWALLVLGVLSAAAAPPPAPAAVEQPAA